MQNSGTARMRPRARLIGLIGEELISDEPVAVVELVKNAYDADAGCVRVGFEGNDPDRPDRIVIEDRGVGMSLDTVLNAWLEPGTITKKKADRSPGGRLYQGAKGIGRFASARLGDTLLLETRQEGDPEGVRVLLNWGSFGDESYLEEITIDYEVGPIPDLLYGTRLTIEGLKEGAWSRDSFEQLHARLSRLISPFQEVEDFRIELEVPGHPDLSGNVEPPEVVLRPKYQLSGEVDHAGRFTGKIAIDGKVVSGFTGHKLGPTDLSPICGPFDVEIRAWDRDREGLEPIAERESQSITQIRKTLNAYCGVSVYRDGFRVHPYGETGNDWANLDLRSRQNPVRNLANNQIIAAVRISRHGNPGLRDRSTREGMVRNAEHAALEDWFKRVLTQLEEVRYKVRPRREAAVRTEPLFEAFDLAGAVKEVRGQLGEAHPVTKLVQDTEKQIAEGVDRVQEIFTRLLMSAGLGHMVDIVIHEIGAPLGKINRQLLILEKDLTKRLDSVGMAAVRPNVVAIKGWLEQIHNLRQRLDPQTPAKRGRATSFEVLKEIELNIELYRALIHKQGIDCRVSAPRETLKVHMSRAALGQVMANLIDNAVFWLVHHKGSGGGGRINIAVKPLDHGFVVRVADDGPGVPDESRETIFEPYYSTKPNGIGLGLYIARLVMEPYGRLLYRDGCKLPGACFEARFEKGVGR